MRSFGIVGLETAFGVAYTELVEGGVLTLPELINRMSTAPARAFHLPGGASDRGGSRCVCAGRHQALDGGHGPVPLQEPEFPFGGRRVTGR